MSEAPLPTPQSDSAAMWAPNQMTTVHVAEEPVPVHIDPELATVNDTVVEVVEVLA
jgi:hypothetical protein